MRPAYNADNYAKVLVVRKIVISSSFEGFGPPKNQDFEPSFEFDLISI